MKQKIILLLLVLSCTLSASAQEVQVKSFKELVTDLSARTSRRYDLNDEPCALIKVECPIQGATFEGSIIGDAEFKNNEYWVYVSKGTKRIKIHVPGYSTIFVEFADYEIGMVESNQTYIVDLNFPSKFKTSFYAEVGFTPFLTMGVDIAAGMYLGGYNIEFDAKIPMAGTESVYWQEGTNAPVQFNYKPTIEVGGRLGYGIMCGKKFKITPQVGLMYMMMKETAAKSTSLVPTKNPNCTSLTIDCKCQYLITKNLNVSITPEYDIAIVKSKGLKALSEVSSKIKSWNNGFGLKIALGYEF